MLLFRQPGRAALLSCVCVYGLCFSFAVAVAVAVCCFCRIGHRAFCSVCVCLHFAQHSTPFGAALLFRIRVESAARVLPLRLMRPDFKPTPWPPSTARRVCGKPNKTHTYTYTGHASEPQTLASTSASLLFIVAFLFCLLFSFRSLCFCCFYFFLQLCL